VPASRREPLPHGFPFRLVETAEMVGEKRVAVVLATGGSFLTGVSEWPVTLVVEALAQAILAVVGNLRHDVPRLVAMNEVRLLQPVGPGARLEVEVEERAVFAPLRRYSCRATRAGALAATAEITVAG
jgi:3-hydroxymyristoyl/3-hydroxydecanoyl-(acyl carrier protein) dehydratase